MGSPCQVQRIRRLQGVCPLGGPTWRWHRSHRCLVKTGSGLFHFPLEDRVSTAGRHPAKRSVREFSSPTVSTGTTAAQKSQATMRSPAETVKLHPSNDPEGIFQSAWGVKCHVLAVAKPGGAGPDRRGKALQRRQVARACRDSDYRDPRGPDRFPRSWNPSHIASCSN